MKHKLKVSVEKSPIKENIVQCHKVSIREKILIFLFGHKHDMMIVIQSNRIGELTINQTTIL